MPNIGTGYGESITDSKLKIAGDSKVAGGKQIPYASEFISYGSYSGADIKVLVHLPYSNSKVQNGLSLIDEINEVEAALSEAEGFYEIKRLERQLEFLKKEYDVVLERGYGSTTQVLGNLQTISWSVFREKKAVRRLGSTYPKSIVRGQRTLAGTMVFTLFNVTVLSEILEKAMRQYSTGQLDKDIYIDSTMLIDQLPPLDISLIFANEYGSISHMGLWGVDFFAEGGTFSIEDIYSEVTVQYMARDYDPMRVMAQRELDDSGTLQKWRALTASQLARENATVTRRNPFL